MDDPHSNNNPEETSSSANTVDTLNVTNAKTLATGTTGMHNDNKSNTRTADVATTTSKSSSRISSLFSFLQQLTNYDQTTTIDGLQMWRQWTVRGILPLSIVTYAATQRIFCVIAAIVAVPTIGMMQGSITVLKYRLNYGDSPLPKAPSHGIVKVQTSTTTTTTTTTTRLVSSLDDNGSHTNNNMESSSSSQSQSPLRLLVIGDSLAIGVGQSSSSTPIMPETIAKSLSKHMGGRPVLWTCHGAPGASAGWIVRELERSIQHGNFLQQQTSYGAAGNHNNSSSTASLDLPPTNTQPKPNNNNSRSATDESPESSSDESSLDNGSNIDRKSTIDTMDSIDTDIDNLDEETQTWQDRLRQERIQFDPSVVGPFDIAVVLTGSNDLKSAFFPFLLTGEDREFRRQAQLRGGSYGNELSRLLQVLNQRMRLRLQTLRESVEAATETIRERLHSYDVVAAGRDVNNNGNGNGNQNNSSNNGSSMRCRTSTSSLRRSSSRPSSSHDESASLISQDDDDDMMEEIAAALQQQQQQQYAQHATTSNLFPMVVLPGMPSRALPIFQNAPLRWFAVPIVDIMDSHKRNLARQHQGEVLFVDAPSTNDIADYACHSGKYWRQQQEDDVLLNLRDIKRRQARKIESEMKGYYLKEQEQQQQQQKTTTTTDPERLPLRNRHLGMFSVDGIHPNDQGYEFWGRYIAQSIMEEWKRKQSSGIELI
jgi:lysophospholipase L1-like esterase